MENELFEKAPVPKAYFTMALPVVMGMVVSLVYNMVDTFFIARTQNTDLVAGVSLCAPIFTLMIALGDIFGLGGSSVISRLFGEKREEEGKRVSGFCFYAAILCGVAVTLLMLFLQTPILRLLGATEDTMEYARQYYRYMAYGAPFIIVSLTPSNLIRTEGLAVQSMIATVTGSIVNIILDPVFIFGFGMGAGGAAIATVLGNVATDILLIYFVKTKSHKLTISPKQIRIEAVTFGVLVMVGFAFGAQPLLGYNYGAKNTKRLKEILRFDLMVEVGFSVVVATILALFAPQMVNLFMHDTAIIESGSLMLRCMLISTPLIGVVLVFTTLFQAEGKAVPALLLSVSRQGVLFAICLIILSAVLGYHGVICAQATADVLTALLAISLYVGTEKKLR